MKILVTGSTGHLGEAVMRQLAATDHEAVGIDMLDGPYTRHVGTIVDRDFVRLCMAGANAVIHTATLHKPHVATHTRQDFIDTNITGTLNLLEEAAEQGAHRFAFTSTTSAFGEALVPPKGEPAAWITEAVAPVPKNIYGLTKVAAEDLCYLFHRKHGLDCIVLRTSRFFPEEDDSRQVRNAYADANAKTNEYPFRRVDIEDAADAHLLALERASEIGFGRYIISATTPFLPEDLAGLRSDAAAILKLRVPEFEEEYQRLGWQMFESIDRVYVNEKARSDLRWRPKYDFQHVVTQIKAGNEPGSALAQTIGCKGYHRESFADGPYPTE
jgi:nucleoside-diphosphate-sugar epimerase